MGVRSHAIDVHVRQAARAMRQNIFAAWLTTKNSAQERRLEELDRHQASLDETRRQAMAARQAAQETARLELEHQRTFKQTESTLQVLRQREQDLAQEVADLRILVQSRGTRLIEYERQVDEMQAELGTLTAELLEERWQLAGAQARLEGRALATADSSLQRSCDAMQKWKLEHQRSMMAIVQEAEAPAILSGSLGSLQGQSADEVDIRDIVQTKMAGLLELSRSHIVASRPALYPEPCKINYPSKAP